MSMVSFTAHHSNHTGSITSCWEVDTGFDPETKQVDMSYKLKVEFKQSG
jgi:hypothetical protein